MTRTGPAPWEAKAWQVYDTIELAHRRGGMAAVERIAEAVDAVVKQEAQKETKRGRPKVTPRPDSTR